MKKLIFLAIALLLIVFFSFFPYIKADFSINTNNTNIIKTYAPNETLKGFINISLSNERYNSLLSGYSDSIKIYDFLKNNGLALNRNFTCSTPDCGNDYTSDSPNLMKSFILNNNQSKIIGFRITDNQNIDDVSNFSLTLSSNAPESCNSLLKIDILNNQEVNWMNHLSAGSLCSNKKYGCYSEALGQYTQIVGGDYCERVEVDPAPEIKVGADINGTGAINFTIVAFNENDEKECRIVSSGSGAREISCIINLTIEQKQNITICLTKEAGSNDYRIKFEDSSPICGDKDGFDHDFSIFAQPMKFREIGSVVLKTDVLINLDGEDISSYVMYGNEGIDYRYSSNCSRGCIIPIKFTSYMDNQIISLTFPYLKYEAGGLLKESNDLYNVSETPSVLSMPYTLLDLSKANIRVPSDYGNSTLRLMLGDALVKEETITILRLPQINSISPLVVPAGANTTFILDVSGSNITSYKWDFGDNSSVTETTENTTFHKYNNLSNYSIKVNVSNLLGESSKTFVIQVVNPREYLNSSLNKSEEKIDFLRRELINMSLWEKQYFETLLNLNALEANLTQLKVEFNQAGGDTAKYVSIINRLDNLNIPSSIEKRIKSSGDFIIDKSIIRLSPLQILGAGTPDVYTEEEYKESIYGWFINNIETTVNLSSYFIKYESTAEEIQVASGFKVNIVNKNSTNTLYFVINRDKSETAIKDISSEFIDINQSSTGFSFLSSSKEIEFIIPESIEQFDTPIYMSPDFSKLTIISEIGPCNFNRRCESELEETWKNCRNDCRPWPWIIFWIILILLVGLIVYIILQEWYKRYYEGYLFPNKDDLFNLINFIENAERQGLEKEELTNLLKGKGWSGEQITYAIRKFKGKRTGMWEIPIFKFVENRRVRQELEKRREIRYKELEQFKPKNRRIQTSININRPAKQVPQKSQEETKKDRIKEIFSKKVSFGKK